jgi:hypothetical protein
MARLELRQFDGVPRVQAKSAVWTTANTPKGAAVAFWHMRQ